MSVLTLITLAVVVLGMTTRLTYVRALAIGGATPAGAAVVAGATAVPTFYAIAIGAAGALGGVLLGRAGTEGSRRDRLPPGGVLLLGFLVWSTVVTMVAPVLFDGTSIVTAANVPLSIGVVTSSNIAQIVYLALGVAVVVYLARSPHTRPELVGLLLGTTLLLCGWRLAHQDLGVPFPEGLFDNSPTFTYIETAAGGIQRFRGILTEPAGLAATCVSAVAYLVPRALDVTGPRRLACVAGIALACYMGVISTSATFVLAGLITLGIYGGVSLLQLVRRRATLSVAIWILACGALVGLALAMPTVIAFVQDTINDKLGSSSYDARTTNDSSAFVVFLDTYGFGVGLGSSRAASFLPTLLSATGAVGAILFVSAVVALITAVRRERACRPVVWAFVAFMVVKVISAPDLSDPSGLLWITLGVMARYATTARAATALPATAHDAVKPRP